MAHTFLKEINIKSGTYNVIVGVIILLSFAHVLKIK